MIKVRRLMDSDKIILSSENVWYKQFRSSIICCRKLFNDSALCNTWQNQEFKQITINVTCLYNKGFGGKRSYKQMTKIHDRSTSIA